MAVKVQAKPKPKGRRTGKFIGADRSYLRGLGHHLEPVILVGHKGVTESLVAETRVALGVHELIKVKAGTNAPEETAIVAETLATLTGAHVVQVIGGVVLLYSEPPDPEKRKIQIPGR